MKKKVSFKTINKNTYVYRWEYIPKADRLDERQRFQWTYIGPVSGKGGEYINSFTVQEEKEAAEYVFGKAYSTLLKKEMKSLEKVKPFSDRLKDIDGMSKKDRAQARKELREELEMEADKYVKKVLASFSPKSLWDYLRNGGTLDELVRKTKRSQR